MPNTITQRSIILEYYQNNPNRSIKHPEIVDWAVAEYKKRTGKVFRDPDRQIRNLHQQGILVKISTGVYRYNPQSMKKLENFTPSQKAEILERDECRCVVCGKGERDGVKLHIDHIKPRDKGGESIVENGQVLCAAHNFKKKNYNQTETAKRLFVNLLAQSRKVNDHALSSFCIDILRTYDKHGINGRINWNRIKDTV